MKFKKPYIDYVEEEIEISETEMEEYYENARCEHEYAEDIAYEMALNIYTDNDSDNYHDEEIYWDDYAGSGWDNLYEQCLEYVRNHRGIKEG